MSDYTINEEGEWEPDEALNELFERWIDGDAPPVGANPAGREPARELPPVPMPERIDVRREPRALVITRRWFQIGAVFTIGFAAVWNTVIAGFIATAVGTGMGEPVVVVFLLPFVAVGLGLLYAGLAGIANRTTVRVGDGTLSVSHHPLPWVGSMAIPSDAVTQLYTRKTVHTSRSSRSAGPTRTTTTRTFDVMVCHGSDHRELRLVRNLQRPNQAWFIEYTVERYLGITDRPIRGEMQRS